MKPTRILIADDHLLFADGLSTILQQTEHLQIIGIAANGEELLALQAEKKADLVLLDISMPGMNGLNAAEMITAQYPSTRILVITMNDSTDILVSLMKANVDGIVFKNTGKSELIKAISEIQNGNKYFSQAVTQQLAKGYSKPDKDHWQLTKREREVLQLIYEGLSTAEIGTKLFVSPYTVETHRKNLFIKTGINKSSQLIKEALSLGYIKNSNPLL
jgi:DNA-binding NarL/FixJ family response regulator